MKDVAYQFAVLRYVHDTVSQEFVNIGVAVYSPDARFFRARCTESYSRASQFFLKIEVAHFRHIVRYIQVQIEAMGNRLATNLPFDRNSSIEPLLALVLPPDDSALQFSSIGVGLTSDPSQTLADLFQRHVEAYMTEGSSTRDDDDVWRAFREPMDRLNLTPRLKPRKIVAPNYEFEFQRAWKNEIVHGYEAVSFDLQERSSLLEKANRWVGRIVALVKSSERFKLHFLLGEPREPGMKSTFIKAQNLLNASPGEKELIFESEREAFAKELALEIESNED